MQIEMPCSFAVQDRIASRITRQPGGDVKNVTGVRTGFWPKLGSAQFCYSLLTIVCSQ